MNIESEQLENRQVKSTVTVEQERVDKALKQAARRIAKQVNIPGFRKGKAPYRIIEQYFGEGAILEEALDPLSQEIYREVLEEEEIEPYAPGALTDVDWDPLRLEYVIPLAPTVELGDYRSVRVDYEPVEITEEDVDDTILEMRHQQATLEPVERPIEMGDAASLDIHSVILHEDEDDEEWIHRHDARVLIREDATYPVAGFPEQVVGMEAGDEREFEITMPEEAEETDESFLGKTIRFEVTCNEVFEYDMPEFDEDFVFSVSDADTIEEFREEVHEQLIEAARDRKRDAYLDEIFEELEDIVTVAYPPVMVEDEIDNMMENFDQRLRSSGLTLEDYLTMNSLEKEDIREDFREAAEERIRRGLTLGELIEAEQLTVSEEEINDEIQTMLLSFGGNPGLARQLLQGDAGMQSIANRVISEKGVERLVAIAKGEEPEIGEPEEADIAPEAVDEKVEEALEDIVVDEVIEIEEEEAVEAEEEPADTVEETAEEDEETTDEASTDEEPVAEVDEDATEAEENE